MHLIIPYANSCSDGAAAALPTLKLPHLQHLLARLSPLACDPGDDFSLSPPHERALAAALGLPVADGQIAWAALRARQLGTLDASGAWGFITLCHWQVNSHHVAMSHLPLPGLDAGQSDALLAAMRPYFEEDGLTLHADQPGRWLARGELLAPLASASPDRVVGRNLAPWIPSGQAAAGLRRLQNEMQMLLYTHPVNDARTACGLVPVNSFWLSGTGALPAGYAPPDSATQPIVIDSLRSAALAEDWPGWVQAWQALDTDQIKALAQAVGRGETVQLTLCGERSGQSWLSQPQSAWQKFKHLFGTQPAYNLLEKL
ncbi:hypothetical protein [Rhodoferax sp.]|uniref:hypothetical protein n=1 Tax=Rhodoferax sp. TaxID=50421 RepID=UPI0026168B7D|nr:hypothetical protein [Rhodoferax sp.]MDD2926141.1 hypothetical protein [Rhodoferax sp.]